MALAPGVRLGVGGVQAGLEPQPRVRHRPEIDLHERAQLSVLPIDKDHHHVGGEGALLRPVLERLACFALPPVDRKLKASRGCAGGERDVQLGQRRRMREEHRVGGLALTAARQWLPAHQAVSAPCRPVMVRRRPALPVGAAAPSEPEIVQPAGAVAQRPLGYVGEQPRELILAHDTVGAHDAEQAMIDVRQRGAAWIETTRPHDTTTVARSTSTHERNPPQRGGGEHRGDVIETSNELG